MKMKALQTAKEDYFLPIIQTLGSLGGSGGRGEVLDRVGVLMRKEFTRKDRIPYDGKPEPRWRTDASYAYIWLCKNDYLQTNSPRGVWVLSKKGNEKFSEIRRIDETRKRMNNRLAQLQSIHMEADEDLKALGLRGIDADFSCIFEMEAFDKLLDHRNRLIQ